MKTILCISGSASTNSSNTQLLKVIAQSFAESFVFEVLEGLQDLPLFSPQLQEVGIPESVQTLRVKVAAADAVIISTPEYLHNIPAVLKNALEWMTSSGELHEKPILPITFTPAPPRGEYAMNSLLQSLKALNAKVVAELPLFQNELRSSESELKIDGEQLLLLQEALDLL